MYEAFVSISEVLAEINPDAVLWDGFEAALIGIAERCGLSPVAVYSYDKMSQILVDRDEMDEEEAAEYIQFNILGAYVGHYTPIIMTLEVVES